MGIRWTDLSERQRSMINEPSKAVARIEVAEPRPSRLERAEHSVFESWLILNAYAYRHSRTDKRTRETLGAPDFTVYIRHEPKTPLAAALAIEFKLPGNTLSPAQQAWAARYGGVVHVLASAKEAIELVKELL